MNRTGLLIGTLAVVVVIAWLSGVFDSDFSTLDVPDWSFDRDQVDEIFLRSADDSVVFARTDGQWRITKPLEAAPDSTRLNGLLRDLEELGFGAVVSTNPERYGRYGVDSSAASITVRSGGRVERLFVGGSGADYRTVHVRMDGDDRVFSSTGRVAVDADVNDWRDRTIIMVPHDAVMRATLEQGESAFSLSRAGGSWIVEEGAVAVPADSNAVDRWLRRYAPLKGNSFSDEVAFAEASPLAQIVFETIGGSSQGVEIREASSGLLARRPGTTDILTLSSGLKRALIPETATLRNDG